MKWDPFDIVLLRMLYLCDFNNENNYWFLWSKLSRFEGVLRDKYNES